VKAYAEVVINVSFLPGVPEHFNHEFNIKIAEYIPNEFILRGCGVFPRISIDLPRNEENFDKVIEIVKNEMNEDNIVTNLELELEAERIIIAESARASENILRVNKASRFTLPDYVLDFGPVIIGEVKSHIVRATNTGKISTSFHLNHQKLFQSGCSRSRYF
jgi:hydrocephalus-inducing protein